MRRRRLLLCPLLCLPLLLSATASAEKPKPKPGPAPGLASAIEPLHLKGFAARGIGPAVMGGRVSEIALDPQSPYTFYVGLGTGGVMKTVDNGGSWKAVFAKQPVASIGAVAVAPSDANVVWVGSGEANDRNSSGWGNGVYRSTDAGASWTHAGLAASRTIARIVVHPGDPRTAWAAATGDLWGPSAERGLYKTTDAGASWKAVLAAPAPQANRVGAGDVAIDPKDPDTLYAALYARVRTPWSFSSGPAASEGQDLGGLFKTTDGGASWRKLTQGLPGATQRIGLSVFAKDPRIVYAIVQSEEGGSAGIRDLRSKVGGLFRSEDAGESWTRVSDLNPRPFYFSQVRVDPANDKRVYVLGFALHVSEDGGRTFREDRFGKVHPDCHALAIDPRQPQRLILGTDGGTYQSYDAGEHWQHLNTMDAGEYYRINVDLSSPYRICGGLQDNTNWVGPSRTNGKEGITNGHWLEIGGGDGFYCVFDSEDPNLVYAESQEGELHRFDMASGERKQLRPEPAEGQPAHRFHWNSPLIGSAHAKGTLYLAGNHVFRLTRRAERWQRISPDLSAQDSTKATAVGSGAENYGVVYTLAESPVAAGLLWAGTDDGKLWLTEDDGGRWTDLSTNLPAAVKGQWLSRVEPGRHDAKVAYLAVNAHRSQNNVPLAYRTGDGGKTWQSIVGDLPADGPVKVVREDPRNPSLLYAGTEFGLFASLDRGGHWLRLGELPTVAVDDILVHPRDNDLVIATHGRSLFVIDDLAPLQQLTSEVMAKPVHLFPPRKTLAIHRIDGWAEWAGSSGIFRGQNPPEGALLTLWVKQYTGESVELTVKDPAGVPVARLTAPGTPGLSRLSWNLKPTKDLLLTYGSAGDRLMAAGVYTLHLRHGTASQEVPLEIEAAPGVETR